MRAAAQTTFVALPAEGSDFQDFVRVQSTITRPDVVVASVIGKYVMAQQWDLGHGTRFSWIELLADFLRQHPSEATGVFQPVPGKLPAFRVVVARFRSLVMQHVEQFGNAEFKEAFCAPIRMARLQGLGFYSV
eukprot:4597060-Alexandrium_andersonii.AAC.1